MTEPAPATPNNAARRAQMLQAAAEVIAERGFGETRITDVAKRAKASSALVIYYFGTRERLLVDALRYSEELFYDAAEKMLREVRSARDRLSLLVQWTCVKEGSGEIPGGWGLWFDLWAQAFRHKEVAQDRIELDARWRAMIVAIVKEGQRAGEIGTVDARAFARTFAALLDGLSIQVALDDPDLDSRHAYRIAMDFAEHELGLPAGRRARIPRR
jgi:AcrR family transcriptional regulator